MKTNTTIQASASLIHLALTGAALAAFAGLAGCGGPAENSAADPAAGDLQLEAIFVETAPDRAISVRELQQVAEPGATVTVEGRVAGAVKPFSEHFATLVLADQDLTTCERRPGDGCVTPWDACCETRETIAKSRISVQVVGADGRPLSGTLKGMHGLSELDTLIVTGTVAGSSTPDNVILNTTAIHRPGS